MILYTGIPLLFYLQIYPQYLSFKKFPLVFDEEINKERLIISGLSMVVFFLLVIFNKRVNLIYKKGNYSKGILSYVNVEKLYLFFFAIAITLNYFFPWHQFGEKPGVGPSLAAYARNVISVLFVILCVRKEQRRIILYLILTLLIGLVSTQRTNLFGALLAFVLTRKKVGKWKYLIMGFSILIIIAIIGIYRNGIKIGLSVFLYPFYTEGILGSYGFSQAIFATMQNDFWFGVPSLVDVISDTIVKLIPNFYFSALGLDRGYYLLQPHYYKFLSQHFFPMGGYFYLAQYQLAIPYIGPVIGTVFIFFILKHFLKIKDENIKLLLYSYWFLFIKAELFIALKMLVFFLLVYYLIKGWALIKSSFLKVGMGI